MPNIYGKPYPGEETKPASKKRGRDRRRRRSRSGESKALLSNRNQRKMLKQIGMDMKPASSR